MSSIGEAAVLSWRISCAARPRPVMLPELVAVAGARWAAEDCFAAAKNKTGLDHYQVRRYRAWYRHITLSILDPPSSPSPPARNQVGRDPSLPAGTPSATRLKRSPDTCGQLFAPRTYSLPPVITDETGRAMIPLTAAETRRRDPPPVQPAHPRHPPGPSMSTGQTGRRRRRVGPGATAACCDFWFGGRSAICGRWP
jgi:hypothetical protein